MSHTIPAVLASLLMPASVFVMQGSPSSFAAARSLLIASSSPGNAYAGGFSVILTAPVGGDFSAAGGSIVTAAPIAGDELLLGGSISSRMPVAGDFRAAGGSINIKGSVAGDLVALGFSVYDTGRAAGSVFIVAADAAVNNGAAGPVIIYGNTVSLAGDFTGNVKVVTSGHLTLAAGTVIHGTLSYGAPEAATIPASARIVGGVKYTNASYLPNASTSQVLALVSIGIFLLARILGALILAGLLAGLFPKLAEEVAERAYTGRPRSIFLTTLLGFATFIVTPVLFLLLALTFVGIGLALLLLIAYALIALLSLMYAGILFGSILARRFVKRETVLWHDGVIGMLALSLIALIPTIGPLTVLFFTMFSSGALLLLFFHFAFPREEPTPEML